MVNLQVSKTRFSDLGLSQSTLKTLEHIGYEYPSPIQEAFIPVALTGKDCIGQARTGTGKTASFLIPVIEQVDTRAASAQAIVMAPTRELCEQVANEARRLVPDGEKRVAVIVGGKSIRQQVDSLNRGASVVIGTPGRIIDLLSRRQLKLDDLKIVILDEADRMLDIGFRPDIEKILRQCPTERQTMLLSATLPPPVERLAKRYMQSPQMVDLSEDRVAVDTVDQFYSTVDEDRKFGLLIHLLRKERPAQVLVFTRTKRGAERLFHRFSGRLKQVAAIHGDLPQSKRDRVMKQFRSGEIKMLIATDVVGRGIDVSTVSHIVNYDIPEFCDDYVHRVGRTGRLSSTGKGRAFTFVTKEQGSQLTSIEKRINDLLHEFKVDEYEAFRPGKKRQHVMDLQPAKFEDEEFVSI